MLHNRKMTGGKRRGRQGDKFFEINAKITIFEI